MIHQWSCWFVTVICITCSASFCSGDVHGENRKQWSTRCFAHIVYFSQTLSLSVRYLFLCCVSVTSLHSITVVAGRQDWNVQSAVSHPQREESSPLSFCSVEKHPSKSERRVVFGTTVIHFHQLCFVFFPCHEGEFKVYFWGEAVGSFNQQRCSVFILVYFRCHRIMENPLFSFCSLCCAANPFVTAVWQRNQFFFFAVFFFTTTRCEMEYWERERINEWPQWWWCRLQNTCFLF